MRKQIRIGIIICDRYRSCAGGKCFRAMYNREGAFDIYSKKDDVILVGYTSCGGCPGGNIEYAPEEMQKNGADIIHFSTGFVVGYPPCPYISHFRDFIQEKYGMKVVMGTHPIPQKYYNIHTKLKTWEGPEWLKFVQPAVSNVKVRLEYN